MNTIEKIAASHGVKNPHLVLHCANAEHIPFSIACASLLMESYGGLNIFGADPTSSIPNRWKDRAVNHFRYRYYKARRGRYGAQGVGPAQLTSPDLQDQADKIGGCWKPEPNLRVGFRFLRMLNRSHGGNWQLTFESYNGSGPAAVAYGQRAITLARQLHKDFTR